MSSHISRHMSRPARAQTGTAATLAEAIRRHGNDYRTRHQPAGKVRSLLGLLPLCRTPALGGTLYRCSDCGRHEPRWRSCGNRHCPQCQTKAREKWVAKQEAQLLDLPYFHLVFTLPGELQCLLLANKEAGYSLLFRAVAATLKRFGEAHGQLGFTAVLHTWNQRLLPHAHLHVIVPAVAIRSDGSAARIGKGTFLFPVKALANVFRAKFLDGLKRLQRHEGLRGLPPGTTPERFVANLQALYDKDWWVYAKRPFGGPKQVLAYLGRYTHRTAISNHRIRRVDDRHVVFAARDPKRPGKKVEVCVPGSEFLRRFFFHVLPGGFTRIRHYGFLSGGVRAKRLASLRTALGQNAPTVEPLEQRMERLCGGSGYECPHCPSGQLVLVRPLAKRTRARTPIAVTARPPP